MNDLYKQVRRVAIGVIGFTVLLIGIAMIATPGPAILVIPFGLGILATEFVWARRLLKKAKGTLRKKGLFPIRWFK
jgi:tellurite resistance protein TerC